MEKTESPLKTLFTLPLIDRWLPAFAAAAIADPEAARLLGPYIGPPTEKIEGGNRPRVPGDEHFARTWRVIRPGFLGEGSRTYTEYTRSEHKRTKVGPALLALPTQWIMVMAGITALDSGRSQLLKPLWAAGGRFGRDINADPAMLRLPLRQAKTKMMTYFANVTIVPEQGAAFWAALRHKVVMHDLGLISGSKVELVLKRHLPRQLAVQYMRFKPKG